MLLAGNFGECRPGHFHSGLDIKTGGRENLPVHAAADGYVSRIKMEPGGFGHGLYITHPNGYTTLYAHLNDFKPVLQQYVRREQYAAQSWTVDLQLSPEQFPVKAGDLIAYSGNTGGSTAPHLHFEIRDTKTEHPLNPQLFGFDIRDARAPVLRNLYFYDLALGVYESPPKMVQLLRKEDRYVAAGGDTIALPGDYVGIGIVADDYADGSENTLAPYTLEWSTGKGSDNSITLDDIGYEKTRYLHAYADYRTKFNGGPWVQCLFRTPGNGLKHIYRIGSSATSLPGHEGGIVMNNVPVPVTITLRDVAGNESSVQVWLKKLQPGSWQYGHCATASFLPNMSHLVEQSWGMSLPENALYDRMCFMSVISPDTTMSVMSATLGRGEVPLHTAMTVSVQPGGSIPFALRSKMAITVQDGKNRLGTVALPAERGRYKASIRSFGSFRLIADTVAPLIRPLGKISGNLRGSAAIRVEVKDMITSVKSFRGTLDGKWILFEQHGDVWTYVFDAHCPKGQHQLIIRATDENGNAATRTTSFTR